MRPTLLCSLLLLGACTGDSVLTAQPTEVEDTRVETITITGRVLAVDGRALPGAVVQAGDSSVTSGPGGAFALDVERADVVQIEALIDGFSTGHRRLESPADGAEVEFRVLPMERAVLTDAEAGGTITGPAGFAVHFAPGFVDEQGQPVRGPIEVEWTLMNTPDSVAAAPGNMIATAPGSEPFPLESFGMVEVRLTQGGNKVQIVEPAVLEIPLTDTAPFAEGEEAGLWGFDEEEGRWYQEGGGQIVDRTFVATVPHFSVWNCDMPMQTSCQTARFLTPAGVPMVDIEVRLAGVDYMGAWWGRTDSDGEVCLLGRRGSKADIHAEGTYGPMGGRFSLDRQIHNHNEVGTCGTGCAHLGDFVVTDLSDDFDADGFTELGGDCDDGDPALNPGAAEQCNHLDDDCNGEADEGHLDLDHDAFTDCWDCDDGDPIVHPLAPDVCDGVLDNDCDAVVDRREADVDADGSSLCTGDCDDTDALSGDGCGWSQVSAGVDGSCALRSDGSVVCWGWSQPNGAMATDTLLRHVEVGGLGACGFDSEGRVHCWDAFGPLDAPAGAAVQDLALGADHGCTVSVFGSVNCWGEDSFGETVAPTGLYSAVTTSSTHSCALSTMGAVACWGDATWSQTLVPVGHFTQVTTGEGFSCGVRTDGMLRCWGRDDAGQSSPPSGSFRIAAAGDGFACGLREGGQLACWGDLSGGLDLVPQADFVDVEAGRRHVCAVRADGEAICWGAGEAGQTILPN